MNVRGDLKEQLINSGEGSEKKIVLLEDALKSRVKLSKMRDEEMLKKMHIRYFKYYKHWKDFDLLTTILAMIGLILAV